MRSGTVQTFPSTFTKKAVIEFTVTRESEESLKHDRFSSRSLWQSREPILDAIERNAPSTPAADLGREHRAGVIIIKKKPGNELGPIGGR
jgi:hypothetical protein